MIIITNPNTLILNLPIIVTFIASIRYIIGFKTWELFTVLSLILSYYLLNSFIGTLWLTTLIWLALIFIILSIPYLTHQALLKFKMHYYGRMSLVYFGTLIGLILTIPFFKLLQNESLFNQIYHSQTGVIALILIALNTTALIDLQYKKDRVGTIRLIFFTLIISLLLGWLITWNSWNSLIAKNQEIVLIVLLLGFITANWTYLRLTDFARFKQLINKTDD